MEHDVLDDISEEHNDFPPASDGVNPSSGTDQSGSAGIWSVKSPHTIMPSQSPMDLDDGPLLPSLDSLSLGVRSIPPKSRPQNDIDIRQGTKSPNPPRDELAEDWTEHFFVSCHRDPSTTEKISFLAGCLRAAGSYADAFDLYFAYYCRLKQMFELSVHRLCPILLNCASTCTTPAQERCFILEMGDAMRWFSSSKLESLILSLYLEYFLLSRKLDSRILNPLFSPGTSSNLGLLDPQDISLYFSDHHQIILTLVHVLPWTAHDQSVEDCRSVVAKLTSTLKMTWDRITEYKWPEMLLRWCANIFRDTQYLLDVFIKFPLQDESLSNETKTCNLYCLFQQHWLQGLQNPTDDFTRLRSLLDRLSLSLPDSLMAASIMLAPWSEKFSAVQCRWDTYAQFSKIQESMSTLLKESPSTISERFIDVYTDLFDPTRNTRTSSTTVGPSSEQLPRQFVLELDIFWPSQAEKVIGASDAIDTSELASLVTIPEGSLEEDNGREPSYTTRRNSLSRTLISSCTSLSSSMKSFRAAADRAASSASRMSRLSSRSKDSSSGMSLLSRHSSWNFAHTIRISRAKSWASHGEDMDDVSDNGGGKEGIIQDIIMVDA